MQHVILKALKNKLRKAKCSFLSCSESLKRGMIKNLISIRHPELVSGSLKQGIFSFNNLDLFIFLLLSDTKEEKRNQKEENIAMWISFNSKINI